MVQDRWVGDKVQLTETCDDDLPHLITHVETTIGPAADGAATPTIHAALEQPHLLPGSQIVDTGFLDAELLVESPERYGVDLLGPTRLDAELTRVSDLADLYRQRCRWTRRCHTSRRPCRWRCCTAKRSQVWGRS